MVIYLHFPFTDLPEELKDHLVSILSPAIDNCFAKSSGKEKSFMTISLKGCLSSLTLEAQTP